MARGRVCVVGAGSSGLAATKHLLEYGFAVDANERAGEVGGNWNFGAHLDDAGSHGAAYKDSTRHWFEVAHLHYLRGLERTIGELRSGRVAA